jgi:hypothetical protein
MRARDVECSAIADAARSKQLPAIGSNANESSEDISARLAWSDEAESLLELVQEGNTKLWYEGGKSAALRRRPELLGAASLRAHFRTLRFKECGIEALSDAAGFERLEELNVGGNQLRSVRGLPASLRILHAYDNRVRSVSFVRGGAPNLVHLGLGYNSIENVARLAEALELGAPALRCLDLSFNSIVDLRDTALLVSHPALASLWLAGNPVALLPAYRAFIRGEVVLVAEANAAAAAAAELELEKKRIAQEVVGEGTSTRTAPVNLLAQLDGVSIAPRTGAAVAEEQRAYSDEGRRFLRIRINLSAVSGLGAASSSAPPPTAATPAPAPATKRPSSKKGKKGKAAKAEPVAAAEAEACENDGRTKSCAFIVEVVLDGARVHISAEGGEAVLELRPSVELRNALLFDGLRVRILAAGAFVCVRCVPHSLRCAAFSCAAARRSLRLGVRAARECRRARTLTTFALHPPAPFRACAFSLATRNRARCCRGSKRGASGGAGGRRGGGKRKRSVYCGGDCTRPSGEQQPPHPAPLAFRRVHNRAWRGGARHEGAPRAAACGRARRARQQWLHCDRPRRKQLGPGDRI